MTTEVLLYALIALNVILLIVILTKKRSDGSSDQLAQRLDKFTTDFNRLESGLKEDFRINRDESARLSKENRDELNNTLKDFKRELGEALRAITEQNQQALEKLTSTLELKVSALIEKTDANAKESREQLGKSIKEFSEANGVQLEKVSKQVEERLTTLNDQAKRDSALQRESLVQAFREFQETFDRNVKSFNELQKEKFAQMEVKQNELVKGTETKLDIIRSTVEEKLEKTLSERLGQSFETVGKQLIEVQKGLGEMQTLAQDVGGLKKVLSNVKMRGGIGEVQLEMLLQQILAPDQYQANVKTKSRSNDLVEFAIKFPGKDNGDNPLWLPIDAKFPKDIYGQLQNAYDLGDPAQIEVAQKNLDATIKKMAKDISEKYLDPPNTTDFGIMFLPFEGIYAEVVRKASLLEDLQREFKIVVTGPTTLAAILNSLQMGFRTLAIQKRSSEVWKILGAVKKEFSNFEGMLNKAQNNIQTGLDQLDNVMGVRTRAITRKLRSVEELSDQDAKLLLPDVSGPELDNEENN